MPSDQSETATVHLPPRYNLEGRRQLWFVEGTGYDDVVNGALTALLVFSPLIALSGGGFL